MAAAIHNVTRCTPQLLAMQSAIPSMQQRFGGLVKAQRALSHTSHYPPLSKLVYLGWPMMTHLLQGSSLDRRVAKFRPLAGLHTENIANIALRYLNMDPLLRAGFRNKAVKDADYKFLQQLQESLLLPKSKDAFLHPVLHAYQANAGCNLFSWYPSKDSADTLQEALKQHGSLVLQCAFKPGSLNLEPLDSLEEEIWPVLVLGVEGEMIKYLDVRDPFGFGAELFIRRSPYPLFRDCCRNALGGGQSKEVDTWPFYAFTIPEQPRLQQ